MSLDPANPGPRTTHVRAVQGPEDLASVTNTLDMVADYMARRYLPRMRLPSRLKGKPAQRLMFYHTYTPTPDGPPPQPVWVHEPWWSCSLGRTRLQLDKLQTQQATPYLRDLALALAPEARAGRTIH